MSRKNPACLLAFAIGLLISCVIVFNNGNIFLIGNLAGSGKAYLGSLVFLAVLALFAFFEPMLFAKLFKVDEQLLRRRFYLDVLPLSVVVLFRNTWDSSSQWSFMLLMATIGLRIISVWVTRTNNEKQSIKPIVFLFLTLLVLCFGSRIDHRWYWYLIPFYCIGLLFFRFKSRDWLRTEGIATVAALPLLLIGLGNSGWWSTAGVIFLGIGRLRAYSKWVKQRGYGFMMLAIVAGIAMSLEIGLRISPLGEALESRHLATDVQSHDVLFWIHKEVYRGETDFGVTRIKIRGREVAAQKAPGVQRVLCCGGSATFGVDLPPEQAWPQIVEDQLKAKGISVEMLNAGEPGYTVFQIKLLLQYYLVPDYHPDGVVLYVGYNDSQITRGRYSERELWQMMQKQKSGMGTWQSEANQYFQRSRTFNLFAHFLVGVRHRSREKSTPISSPHEFSTTLTELLHYLKNEKIHVLLAAEAHQEPDEIFRRIMQRMSREYGIGYVDVYDRIRKEFNPTIIYSDVVHLTPEGNRVVAGIIADAWASMNAGGDR